MPEYIIQKAVAPSAVRKASRLTLEEYGQRFDAYRKYDGCCAVMAGGFCYSRTGEGYISMSSVAEDLYDLYPDLVFIGEAWWPGKDQFNLISGVFRRGKLSRDLLLIVHDILTVGEFENGRSDVPFWLRMNRVDEGALPDRVRIAEGWAAGSYGCPQELCNRLVDEGGYDGLILRDPHGTWTRGSGTSGEIVKIKRELSFDLRVLEVNTAVGEKTGRTVYKLVVDFRGKRLGVGSGVPHKQEDVPPVGSIVEVVAMAYSSDGLLREPRFKGVRFDKTQPD